MRVAGINAFVLLSDNDGTELKPEETDGTRHPHFQVPNLPPDDKGRMCRFQSEYPQIEFHAS